MFTGARVQSAVGVTSPQPLLYNPGVISPGPLGGLWPKTFCKVCLSDFLVPVCEMRALAAASLLKPLIFYLANPAIHMDGLVGLAVCVPFIYKPSFPHLSSFGLLVRNIVVNAWNLQTVRWVALEESTCSSLSRLSLIPAPPYISLRSPSVIYCRPQVEWLASRWNGQGQHTWLSLLLLDIFLRGAPCRAGPVIWAVLLVSFMRYTCLSCSLEAGG